MDSIYGMGTQKWRQWITYWIKKISLLSEIQEFDDNDAAIAGGLSIGDLYRTVDTVKVVHA